VDGSALTAQLATDGAFFEVDDYSSAASFRKASFLGHAIEFLMNRLVTALFVCHNPA
jgi:hypothetical protein